MGGKNTSISTRRSKAIKTSASPIFTDHGSDWYRGVSAVPPAVPPVLPDGARLGADAGGAAGRHHALGGSCDAAGSRADRPIDADPLLHFDPDRLQGERGRRREVAQVLGKKEKKTRRIFS